MNKMELYDGATAHLEKLDAGLELLMDQATRTGDSLPEGFFFIWDGLKREEADLRDLLDRYFEEGRPKKKPAPVLVNQED